MSAADAGVVWATVTQLSGSGGQAQAQAEMQTQTQTQTTHFALAINVSRPWALSRRDLWPRGSNHSVYLSRRWDRSAP